MFPKAIVLATVLCASASSYAAWISILDCKDVHQNQLVIDKNSGNETHLQLVVRPSAKLEHSAIQYFFKKNLSHSSVTAPSELIVPGWAHGRSIFVANDEVISHEVRDARNGVTLTVTKGSESASWNFPKCEKGL